MHISARGALKLPGIRLSVLLGILVLTMVFAAHRLTRVPGPGIDQVALARFVGK